MSSQKIRSDVGVFTFSSEEIKSDTKFLSPDVNLWTEKIESNVEAVQASLIDDPGNTLNCSLLIFIGEQFEKMNKLKEARDIFEFLKLIREQNRGINFDLLTKIKQLDEKIQHRQAELLQLGQKATLGLMASGLAHEINQPLQIILSRAQNCISDIRRRVIDPENVIEDLEHIASTVKRIDRIVNHLHVLSRERKPKLMNVDINKVIHNSLIMFNQQLKARGIEVALDLADPPPFIRADVVQMEEVFINLITNARDSLEEKQEQKTIAIATRRQEGRIRIVFHDNGKGIDPDKADHIFEPFYTTKEKGMGLGLYISRDIIESYGGAMRIESEKGENACFIISLPVAGEEEKS